MGILRFGAAMAVAAMGSVAVPAAPPPEPKPTPKRRDDDHHALYWLFGRRNTNVRPIESPKPLGKRARRRLRGRIKEEKRNGKA